MRSRFHIQDFNRIVSKGGHIETLRGEIQGQWVATLATCCGVSVGDTRSGRDTVTASAVSDRSGVSILSAIDPTSQSVPRRANDHHPLTHDWRALPTAASTTASEKARGASRGRLWHNARARARDQAGDAAEDSRRCHPFLSGVQPDAWANPGGARRESRGERRDTIAGVEARMRPDIIPGNL